MQTPILGRAVLGEEKPACSSFLGTASPQPRAASAIPTFSSTECRVLKGKFKKVLSLRMIQAHPDGQINGRLGLLKAGHHFSCPPGSTGTVPRLGGLPKTQGCEHSRPSPEQQRGGQSAER